MAVGHARDLHVGLQGGGGERRGEERGLVHPHAHAPVLVQTEEDVTVPRGHDVEEGGGVSLEGDGADGLAYLSVHDDNLSRVDDEKVVLLGGGEDNFPAVDLWNTLLPSEIHRELRCGQYTVVINLT